jgi:hypothetical protein
MNAATITVQQLGGTRRLNAIIGAKDFMSDNDGQTLMFNFSGSKVANYVRITLNALDLYDIEFKKIGRKAGSLQAWKTGEFENIDAENLKNTIESFTGLYLSI